jgi:hypothetical protein
MNTQCSWRFGLEIRLKISLRVKNFALVAFETPFDFCFRRAFAKVFFERPIIVDPEGQKITRLPNRSFIDDVAAVERSSESDQIA